MITEVWFKVFFFYGKDDKLSLLVLACQVAGFLFFTIV